jgi:hypothetical protein
VVGGVVVFVVGGVVVVVVGANGRTASDGTEAAEVPSALLAVAVNV